MKKTNSKKKQTPRKLSRAAGKSAKLIQVKKLTELGRDKFETWIEDTRQSEKTRKKSLAAPTYILSDPKCSSSIPTKWEIDKHKTFTNRYYLGEYLEQTANKAGITSEEEENPYIWAWLALLFIDQLRRKQRFLRGCLTNQSEHWIPDEILKLRNNMVPLGYRHSTRMAYRLVKQYGPKAKIFFSNKMDSMGDGIEQLYNIKKLRTNEHLLDLIIFKYADATGHLQRKALDYAPQNSATDLKKKKGYGKIRRLKDDFLPSICLTYDIEIMNEQEILDAGGKEFK